MKLVECDGGSKDEETTAADVLLSHDTGTLASLNPIYTIQHLRQTGFTTG